MGRVAQVRVWFTNLGLSFDFSKPANLPPTSPQNNPNLPRTPPARSISSRCPPESLSPCPMSATSGVTTPRASLRPPPQSPQPLRAACANFAQRPSLPPAPRYAQSTNPPRAPERPILLLHLY